MRIVLGADHAGFEIKEVIKESLLEEDFEVIDLGAETFNPDDDYPEIIAEVAHAVSIDPQNTRGIIFGGSGQGEAMVANRFKNVRAVVYYGDSHTKKEKPFMQLTNNEDEIYEPFEMVALSREHNDSNILALGARFLSIEQALSAVSVWLSTEYNGDERHERRIQQIEELFTQDNSSKTYD